MWLLAVATRPRPAARSWRTPRAALAAATAAGCGLAARLVMLRLLRMLRFYQRRRGASAFGLLRLLRLLRFCQRRRKVACPCVVQVLACITSWRVCPHPHNLWGDPVFAQPSSQPSIVQGFATDVGPRRLRHRVQTFEYLCCGYRIPISEYRAQVSEQTDTHTQRRLPQKRNKRNSRNTCALGPAATTALLL